MTPVQFSVRLGLNQSFPEWVHDPSLSGSAADRLDGAPQWRRWSWGESRHDHGLLAPGPGPGLTGHFGPYQRAERELWHTLDPPERPESDGEDA